MTLLAEFPGHFKLAAALVRRADRARDRGAFAKAAKIYFRALRFDPSRTEIFVQYGHMLKEIGQFREAEAAYRHAVSRLPRDAGVRLELAHFLKLTGRIEEALENYHEVLGLLPANAVRSVSPQNPELAPLVFSSDAVSDRLRYEAHVFEGDCLRDARRYAHAAEAYGAAVALAPFRTDIRVQYANMLKDAGRFVEAEANYQRAASEKPHDADLHVQLGHVLKLQGKHAAAQAAYERAAQLDPCWLVPQEELFRLGQPASQEALFEAHLRVGGVDALATITQNILELRKALDHLVEALPDVQSRLSFPVGCYDAYRARYDVPAPPRPPPQRSFGILLLADREPLETLYAQLNGIVSQIYESWRLYVIGTVPAKQRIVERAGASDARIRWIQAGSDETAADAERKISLSTGADWIILLSEGGLLHPRALEWFASVAHLGTAVAFITDEETVTRKHGYVRRCSPEFRQVVDYDTLLEMNNCGETIAVELASYASVADALVTSSVSASRSSLLLALARGGRVGHIPCPLVCRNDDRVVDPGIVAAAHEEAVRGHLVQHSLGDRITIGRPSGPLPRLPILWRPRGPRKPIAVIIPTRDNGIDVARFIDSLAATASATDAFRVTVVDNGSREEKTRRILSELEAGGIAQVLSCDEPFNWSRLNNRAVQTVNAPFLVFANDDMIMLSDGWDERVRGLLERPEIGALGVRLLYEDDTVQHAGVLFGWNGSVIHDGLCARSTDPGPASRWQVSRAVGAVTGAFLATRRDVFLRHRGFDEVHLAVSYSDIDYALKLRASGLKVLWTPAITLYHHESKTRGLDQLDPEKSARDAAERAVMQARWGAAMVTDPSVNPIWHMATLPFRLLSAPSQSRLWAHIESCATRNPWLPERENHRCSLQDRAQMDG